MPEAAERLAAVVTHLWGSAPPLRLRTWDGSEAGPADAPVLVIRSRRALHRLLWRPGELGLARAWVAGEIDIEGDLYQALDRLAGLVWGREEPPGPTGRGRSALRALGTLRDPATRRLLGDALALAGAALPPPPPPEEVPRRNGIRHTPARDRAAISHHYDVGNDFYALLLGPSMVYSCAYWQDGPDTGLDQAQHAKLDLVCRKLALRPGQRLLDVGCGWGSMVLHAAEHYGVQAVGVTLSEEQATYARKRVAAAGHTDLVEIRVQDYREIPDGPYDAISSIGMAEHVGSEQYLAYADRLHALLKPGGRLLNHQISRRPLRREEDYRLDDFIDRYVFPDGELAPVGSTVSLLEKAGFEVRDVEALREHYALTLRAWGAHLEAHWDEAVRLVGAGRARVWRLYMAASAVSFERNGIGVNQVLAVRPEPGGVSGMPPSRGPWAAQ
ncbi:class I SAM-dependent methyltransferase [Peterkaempfera bronchialis]|uniref:class I SAM-dependent methyltransferase n=1 Tax=Peterkaempfera bronchialis TaxID=2126346 RepID=UPI003C30DCEC